jgi:hypothetical protein
MLIFWICTGSSFLNSRHFINNLSAVSTGVGEDRHHVHFFAGMHLTHVIWHEALRAFGLKTGNCLSNLGAVRTAADINRGRTAQLIFIIDLNQPFGQRRSLLRLQHEFWPASNRMPASRSNDLTWAKRITVKFFSKNCKKRLDMPHSGMLHISPL